MPMLPFLFRFKAFLIIILVICSCKQKEADDSASLARREHYAEVIEVRTTPAIIGNFSRELMSNGRLKAVNKATVTFRVQEMIKEVKVHNGQWVEQGQVLAVLEDFPFASRLERAQDQIDKTRLELEDILLGHNHFLRDSLQVPEHLWSMARTRSGYNSALNDLAEARYQMTATRIVAPISGIVADLEVKAHNHSSSYTHFCVIVNNSSLEARFPVLESETSLVAAGQPVEISPFASNSKSFTGRITGFDPSVDDQGMVMVTALINNPGAGLMDGMNVQVIVKREIPGQLIIPREALVLRQGRQVVFTLQDSIAMWNYVEPGYENSREFSINSGLTENQEVIISGNFNLAHETKVKKVE